MRKWKNNSNPVMSELNKASLIFLVACNVFTVFGILLTGQISIMQIIGLVTGSLMIYGIWSGKFYSLLRWYFERRLKKWDNKWR